MNVRVWKANASEQLGTLLPRERKRQQYNAALVERHKHLPGEGGLCVVDGQTKACLQLCCSSGGRGSSPSCAQQRWVHGASQPRASKAGLHSACWRDAASKVQLR